MHMNKMKALNKTDNFHQNHKIIQLFLKKNMMMNLILTDL
jgi:hypothetical protein